MSPNSTENKKLDLLFLKNISFEQILLYPLSFLDLLTTTYGIAKNALDLPIPWDIISAIFCAIIVLWSVIFSKNTFASGIQIRLTNPIKEFAPRVKQSDTIEFLADTIVPVIIILFSIIFIIIDFWTSWAGVSKLVPFKGLLGMVIKSFLVFALVFSTVYIIYLQPKQID
jgi:hypothetical protein